MPVSAPQQSFISTIFEYTRMIFGAVIVASLVRAIWFEPFKIPSSSMVPTLLIGDYLFVDKNNYGYRNPCNGERFALSGEPNMPARGDVVVFQKKKGPFCGTVLGLGSLNFIKRIVAVPGDTVAYRRKQLYINGDVIPMTLNGTFDYQDATGRTLTAARHDAVLGDVHHAVLTLAERPAVDMTAVTVPAGKYVVIGDNRDNSLDSRFWQYPQWGFVDMADIVGRAEFIFWSWDDRFVPRLDRVGTSLRAEKVAR